MMKSIATVYIALVTCLTFISLGSCKDSTAQAKAVIETVEAKPRAQSISTTEVVDKNAEPVANYPFELELKDADGKSYSSKDVFKKNGKPTVLLFWLTTCKPCHMKLNAIAPNYSKWKEEADFNIFAISGDYPKNFEKFAQQTKSKNWEWDTYIDVNRSFREILPGNLNGFPQTFIFDKDGKLVYQDKRYRPGDERRLIEKIKSICNS